MAKLPGYLRPVGKGYKQGSEWVQDFQIRPWHPSLLGELWRRMEVRPTWAKPFVVVVSWWRAIAATHAANE